MRFYSFSLHKKRKYTAYLELWIWYLILPFSPVTDENRTDIDSETTFWFDFCVHTIWILLKGKIRCKIVLYDHTFNQRLKWQVIALFIKVNVKSEFLCNFCNFNVWYAKLIFLLFRLMFMSEWFLFNIKWAIFQQYHGENNLHFDEMMKMPALY